MLTCQREKFFLPSDKHYLNCAYFSPLMRSVEEAGIEALRMKREPALITPAMFFEGGDRVRVLFASLINGRADQVAIIPAASYGIATIARNIKVGYGDNLVLIQGQFPSNVYSWHRLAENTGAAIRMVEGHGANWTQRVLESIDYRTSVVAMGIVHWTDGTLFDVKAIGKRARDVGAVLIIDGTQSIGALPFDVQEIQPDALVCSGYKWLMGPYGTGLLYVGERFLDGIPLEESWITRQGSDNFDGLLNYTNQYRPGAIRYDRGQTTSFAHTAMMIKGLEQVIEWQPENIQTYCENLIADFLPSVQNRGYNIIGPYRPHLFGIDVPTHVNRQQLLDQLTERNISVSLRGDAIRVSPNVYNNAADVDALHDALLSAAK
ncbi:MAG: aminotransferase class V-fold PLP-dependent enzyme [Bacteroidetes bacterium]|nr:aminotransferase class V-fold PLP-dependent enzyme [Bacteroidota bacterium]MDE2671064.1 aminotransferase class V-fold PLP-dependent enzyme [Bacteroidota bacterium]